MENLIGKKVRFEMNFALTKKEFEIQEKKKQQYFAKMDAFSNFKLRSFLCEAIIIGHSTAGTGDSFAPCLLVQDLRLVNKKDEKYLKDKTDKESKMSHVFLHQVTDIK